MKSIRNYVNTQDFVTGVPLTAWGYDKYGVTEVFESTDYRRNNDAFARAYLSLGKVGMKINNDGKSAVKNFYRGAASVQQYYHGGGKPSNPLNWTYPGDNPLFDLCYDHIAPGAVGAKIDEKEVKNDYQYNKFKILIFFKNQADTTIFYSHTPETYYAYISQRW